MEQKAIEVFALGNMTSFILKNTLPYSFFHRRYVEKESSNRCVATFSLQDEPACFTISRPASDEEPMILGAVSFSGILHVFEHHLNGLELNASRGL